MRGLQGRAEQHGHVTSSGRNSGDSLASAKLALQMNDEKLCDPWHRGPANTRHCIVLTGQVKALRDLGRIRSMKLTAVAVAVMNEPMLGPFALWSTPSKPVRTRSRGCRATSEEATQAAATRKTAKAPASTRRRLPCLVHSGHAAEPDAAASHSDQEPCPPPPSMSDSTLSVRPGTRTCCNSPISCTEKGAKGTEARGSSSCAR
jgi:hypothetical protein